MDKNLNQNQINSDNSLYEAIFELAFELLPRFEGSVNEQTSLRPLLEPLVLSAANSLFGPGTSGVGRLGKFGQVNFPNYRMGAVDSFMHFELRELAVFAIYLSNKEKYSFALDLGANLGLHSILLSLIGISEVSAVEPDPVHVEELRKRLLLNKISNVSVHVNAVSDFEGKASFTRVVGNTTSSHLTGLKPSAYGELEEFEVEVINVNKLLPKEGRIVCKIDIEGSEAAVLKTIDSKDWERIDAIIEVTTPQSAKEIFEFLSQNKNVYGYSQKIQWRRITRIDEVPFNYKEGSLFLTSDESWKFPS